MLAVIVHIEAHAGSEDALMKALEENALASRLEDSCHRWEWSRHREDPQRFAIYELYDDAEAVAAHKASDHFAHWTSSDLRGEARCGLAGME